MSTALHLTVEEFDRMVGCGAFDHLKKKIELFRGELREMNPAGPLHDGLIIYLTNWSVLAAAQCGLLVTSQTGLNLAELESRPEPDLMWLTHDRYRRHHPGAVNVKLAIEVAHSSLEFDLREKVALYAEANIAEYWVVDAAGACIHVYRHPQNGQYTEQTVAKCGQKIVPLAAPEAELDLDDLFASE